MELRDMTPDDYKGFVIACVIGFCINILVAKATPGKEFDVDLHGFARRRWLCSAFIQVRSLLCYIYLKKWKYIYSIL